MAGDSYRLELTQFVKTLDKAAADGLAQAARDVQRRIENEQAARKGVKPFAQSAVDGQVGKPFEQVRPDGVIYIEFDYREEICKVAFDELRARSPIGPAQGGHYRDEHFCLLDGNSLAPLQVPTGAMLANVNRVVVTNAMPYSRKLEVGLTKSGRSFSVQVEPHIFQAVALHLSAQYRAVANIGFAYVGLAEAATGGGSFRLSGGRRRRSSRSRRSAAMRFPAIIIDRI